MRLLERYVLGEHVLPFLLGFTVVTVIFIFNWLFEFLDLIVTKGVPAPIVLKMFVLALGWITALSFPCGVLVASLMTFGRMAQDNEITALRACGVHLGRIFVPVLLAATVLACFLALFNNYVLPETNHAFANLSIAVQRKSPTAVIRAGVFNDDFPDKSLLVSEINDRTGEMKDITIYDFATSDIPTTILAREGRLRSSPDGTTLRIDLMNGEIHEVPSEGDVKKYRRLRFANHTIILRDENAALNIPMREARGEREMNIARLEHEISRLEASYRERELKLKGQLDSLGFTSYQNFEMKALPEPKGLSAVVRRAMVLVGGLLGRKPDLAKSSLNQSDRDNVVLSHLDLLTLKKRINAYTVEVHKKFSIPFACIVFVLLGAPMGLRARRGGMATSAISIVFFVIYYLFLIGGEQLADRNVIAPVVAMWAPNVVLGIPGLWLTWSALQSREGRS
jgi:lipopolysaccharide export system permease protein